MLTVKPQMRPLSAQRAAYAARVIPGGVNSPFRSFQEVGGHTIFFARGQGSRLFDIDGNSYIDYLGAWGPAVLGHSHPDIVAACQKVLALGAVFGATHDLELQLATKLIEIIPSLEQVRFVSSGTEAVMSAVRLARGYTGRNKIIMFEGGYHGHSDSVLASSRHASSAGIPQANAALTLLVEFNNLPALEQSLTTSGDDVAAVLVEPVPCSMSVVPPQPGYLESMLRLCRKYGALLIFDEVLTGCRVNLGGAQAHYGVKPDLSCFGKALAGGMPVGAFGGSEEIMSHLFPVGKVYQAGTFSGNPVTMAGGVETLRLISEPDFFSQLEAKSARLVDGLQAIVKRLSIPVQLPRVGALLGIAFTANPIKNYNDSLSIDSGKFAQFFHYLLNNGVYLPPSAVDSACLSIAHSHEDIDFTIEICRQAFEHVYS